MSFIRIFSFSPWKCHKQANFLQLWPIIKMHFFLMKCLKRTLGNRDDMTLPSISHFLHSKLSVWPAKCLLHIHLWPTVVDDFHLGTSVQAVLNQAQLLKRVWTQHGLYFLLREQLYIASWLEQGSLFNAALFTWNWQFFGICSEPYTFKTVNNFIKHHVG